MKLKLSMHFSTAVYGFVWLFLMVAGRSKLFRDPGSFSHTAIGAYILDTGNLIHRDFFSYTRVGEPWIAQQWLGECIMAVVQRLAGLDGLLVVTASLIALLYAGLASRIERSGTSLALGSLILALSLAASSHHFHVRPHIVTILFMTLVYARLCDVDAGQKSITSLFWLIPIFVIWANIHGGVLGGILTLLIVVIGWTLVNLLKLHSPAQDVKALSILWVIVFLGFMSPLLNPYGLKLPAAWMEIMRSGAVAQLIQEHASVVTLLQHGGTSSYATLVLLICLGLFYTVLLAGTDWRIWRVSWFIPMIWFVLSLSRVRHAPLFAMMAVVAIAEIIPFCRWTQSLAKRGMITFRLREVYPMSKSRIMSPYLIAAIVTIAALVIFHGSAKLPSTAQKWVMLDGTHWPIEILPNLQTLGNNYPCGTSIFNDMLFGGFLIYHTPGLRVFIDDRCELYGDELITKYMKAVRADFDAWEESYRFDLALLEHDSDYRTYFEGNPDWRVVKRCPAAVLYERRGGGALRAGL